MQEIDFSAKAINKIGKMMEKEEKRGKVTTGEVLIRLILIFGPIVIPPIVASTKTGKSMLPAFWLLFLMPVWLSPDSTKEWDEGAKKFEWIFNGIGKLYLILFIISGIGYVISYKPY